MAMAVVIPALDEEAFLGATLAALLDRPPCPLEVVVVDGGSRDRTARVAQDHGVRVVAAGRGRAAQMNAGAGATSGDPILFLHADTRLGRAHLEAVQAALADPGVAFGSFAIRYDAAGFAPALIARVANLRTRLDRTPYGDQALFVRRSAFDAAFGFPDVPILEDVLIGRALRRHGRYVFVTRPPVLTSARRLEREGMVRTTLRNWATRALFELGVGPHRLRAFHDGAGAGPGPGRVEHG